jgi:hypothetical protein
MMKRKASMAWHIILVVFLTQISHPIHSRADSTAEVTRISVEEVEKLLGNPDVVIIDVRKKKSWWSSTTKIYGAVRQDPSNTSQWLDKYSKDSTLIFYCN